MLFIFRKMNIDIEGALHVIVQANPLLLVVAFASYYAAFPLRAARWQRILANANITAQSGRPQLRLGMMTNIFLLSWFVNCVVPAKLGDLYRGYVLKEHANESFSRTLGTILSERLMDVVALATLLIGTGLLVFHGTVPASLRWWLVAACAFAIAGLGAFAALFAFGNTISRYLPARVSPHYSRLHGGIVMSFTRRRFPVVVGFTLSIWALEGVRMYAVTHAVGVDLSISEGIFVALLASLLTTFPITPAGLGAVEGGTIVALTLLGVAGTDAGAIALVDRGIAYWSVLLIGGIAWLVSTRTRRRLEPSRGEGTLLRAPM
jgi:uncharacterized protein (TIRG00374 family)